MTLCKTEKFSDGFPAEKNVLPYSCTTTLHTIKGPGLDADMLFPPERVLETASYKGSIRC